MDKEKNFVSAVIYLHNDANSVVKFFDSINAVLAAHFEKYEFIVVDDACTDQTIELLRNRVDTIEKPLTILHMSVYHGLEDAMNAGVDATIGDYVFEFDSTQMPYDANLVWDAYRKSIEGNDIVYVCPSNITRSSKLFYGIFNANSRSNYLISTDAFRLTTRRAINRVHASNSYMPYRKAAYAASGLRTASIEFFGKVINTQKNRFSLAINSLALYTNAGYKVSIGFTLFMMIIALIEFIYTIVIYQIGKPIEGWTTTMLVMTFGFVGLFFILSIVIKYLSLTIDMIFRKQKYLIESVEKIQK